MEDLDDLRIASRKYMDNLFILWDRNTNAARQQAVWTQLRADAMEFQADLIIVDTLADIYGGSEIDRSQVNTFVKTCLGRLAQDTGGSLLALGHPSVAGMAEGRSGSTAWNNAARSRIYLRYPEGVTNGPVRELEGMKANYGPRGNLLKLQWAKGAFKVVASATTPTRKNDANVFSAAPAEQPPAQPTIKGQAAAAAPSAAAACSEAVVSAIASSHGLPLSLSLHSGYWAPKLLRTRDPALAMWSIREVEAELAKLVAEGRVVVREWGRNSQRRRVTGLALAEEGLGEVVLEDLIG